jgi:hypothetical protein
MSDMTTGVLDAEVDDTARPGPIRRFTRWLGTPPRLAFHGLCLAATIGLLWAASAPGGLFSWAFGSLLALLGLACVWFLRTLAALFTRQVSWWHLAAPMGGVLVAGLLYVDLPQHARWAVSADAFDSAARDYPARIEAAERGFVNTDRRIGAYSVSQVGELDGGGLYFSVENSGLLFSSGSFYYLPDGSTPREHRRGRDDIDRVTDLGDGWFAVVESW